MHLKILLKSSSLILANKRSKLTLHSYKKVYFRTRPEGNIQVFFFFNIVWFSVFLKMILLKLKGDHIPQN